MGLPVEVPLVWQKRVYCVMAGQIGAKGRMRIPIRLDLGFGGKRHLAWRSRSRRFMPLTRTPVSRKRLP
jgi:hypothetical protein